MKRLRLCCLGILVMIALSAVSCLYHHRHEEIRIAPERNYFFRCDLDANREYVAEVTLVNNTSLTLRAHPYFEKIECDPPIMADWVMVSFGTEEGNWESPDWYIFGRPGKERSLAFLKHLVFGVWELPPHEKTDVSIRFRLERGEGMDKETSGSCSVRLQWIFDSSWTTGE